MKHFEIKNAEISEREYEVDIDLNMERLDAEFLEDVNLPYRAVAKTKNDGEREILVKKILVNQNRNRARLFFNFLTALFILACQPDEPYEIWIHDSCDANEALIFLDAVSQINEVIPNGITVMGMAHQTS